jgi:hypothetical protein
MRRIILVKSNSYHLEENARKTRQNAGKMYKRSRKTDVFVNMRAVKSQAKPRHGPKEALTAGKHP